MESMFSKRVRMAFLGMPYTIPFWDRAEINFPDESHVMAHYMNTRGTFDVYAADNDHDSATRALGLSVGDFIQLGLMIRTAYDNGTSPYDVVVNFNS